MIDRRAMIGASITAVWPVWAGAEPVSSRIQPFLDVRRFGAKGDGKTIDTGAINRAIARAAAQGGGTVLLPAGVYASHTIHLQSHVTIHLSRGAVLLAAPAPDAGAIGGYDAAEIQDPRFEPYQDFGHNHWRNSLIVGEDLIDIGIQGEGMIWGRGLSKGPETAGLPRADMPGVGNKAISLKNCRNVLLRDFTILKGGHFALLATAVDNLVLQNLSVDTDRDGFDIDCCRNVRIQGCTVNSPWDDAIVLKSSYGLGYRRLTENVTISDCHVSGFEVGSMLDGTYRQPSDPKAKRLGRIKFGTESNGGFRNIAISNCVFENCWGLALETVDGGILEDVTISNLTMRNCLSAPIFIWLGARMRGPSGTPPGRVRRILIDNLNCQGQTPYPIVISGIPGAPVEDIRISNVFYAQPGGGADALAVVTPPLNADHYPEPDMFGPLPAAGVFLRHARNIEFAHFALRTESPDRRAAFWLQDVDGFTASGLDVPASSPSFSLEKVRDARVIASAHIPDRALAADEGRVVLDDGGEPRSPQAATRP